MHKLIFFAIYLAPISFCLPVQSPAQGTAPHSFVLTGHVKGLADHSRVFISDVNNATDTMASGNVVNGEFTLKGHINEPALVELNFDGVQKKTPLFLGNDQVKVSGSVDDLRNLEVNGSSSNDDFMEFQRVFNPYFAHLNFLVKEGNSAGNGHRGDSLERCYKMVLDSVQGSLDKYLSSRSNSFVTPWVLIVMSQLSDDVLRLERRYEALSPAVRQGFYGKYLDNQISTKKVGAVGTDALDFIQKDTSGNEVTLSSFKGKYVLVDFWASWCGPCRMENPNVVSTYSRFHNKNFTILGVSLDRSRDPWIKAIKDDGLTWTQVSDLKFWDNAVAVKYHINSIPTNFLIDPTGKIVGRNLRGAELQNKLCELLGCN